MIAALVALTFAASAPPPRAQACSAPEFRQFDFWLGDWQVRKPDGSPDGSAHIEVVPNGCAVLEYRTFANGDVGTAINIFDPLSRQWEQLWSSPGTTVRLKGKPAAASAMAMDGELVSPRAALPLRVTWEARPGREVMQRFEVQRDGQWKPLFQSLYVPARKQTG